MQLWGQAMREALYGPDGFYSQGQPADHFRTSVTASPQFAAAVARLVRRVDSSLGHPPVLDVVDVGAGDGTLLAQVLHALPYELAGRVRAIGVEVRARPDNLPKSVLWAATTPAAVTGLVMAHELLDNVPCDVVERTGHELRQVMVDPDGQESVGPPATSDQRTWLDHWWPLPHDGDRGECGNERDQVWRDLVGSLVHGVVLAVDYGHLREERAAGAYPAGTLTGYRRGHQVTPAPDGSCDITAHVAMDSCLAAGVGSGAEHSTLLSQREALRDLGITADLPDVATATASPQEYVRQLSEASAAAELLDPGSLGSFWWLLQSKGTSLPLVGRAALSG